MPRTFREIPGPEYPARPVADAARIGIIVVAYNAASTLAKVLDRIPHDFVPRISEILICDNASEDQTYLVGLGYKQVDGRSLPLNVIRNPRNLGYGGNQKVGYDWAIEHDLDIVVLLHADGQYAPEFLPQIVGAFDDENVDAVFGSRMMTRGGARQGGMPMYKFIGNKVLSRFENQVVGTDLSEWHSGYRAYRVKTLREIPFQRNSDEYNFDTQIIIQLHEAGKRIVELAIPTFYGDEISYVNGTRYAREIVGDVLRYRVHKMGIGSGETAFASSPYEVKEGTDTAPGRLLAWLSGREPSRVLLLGAGATMGAELRARGHDVVVVSDAEDATDGAIVDDLDDGVPAAAGTAFDVVVAVDALSRVRHPDALLASIRTVLASRGRVMASVPNFAHWYARSRVLLGRWGYDRRGLLDEQSLRFFTRGSAEALFGAAGLGVVRRERVGLPLDREHGRAGALLDGAGLVAWPSLFTYQLVYELDPTG
jgi:glycosyltransferase involved in cell wall biosynthesis